MRSALWVSRIRHAGHRRARHRLRPGHFLIAPIYWLTSAKMDNAALSRPSHITQYFGMMAPIGSYEPAPDLCRAQTRPLLDRKRGSLLRCWFCKRSRKALDLGTKETPPC